MSPTPTPTVKAVTTRRPRPGATGRTPGHRRFAPAAALAVLAAALAGAACTYGVTVHEAPSRAAYAFDDPLPARVAVFVDGEQLWREVRIAPYGDHCEFSTYPVDARHALAGSVLGTLQPLVREVALTPVPLRRDDLAAHGFDTVIAVRAEAFDAAVAATGWSGLEASVGLRLAVSVFTERGLRFRESVSGFAVQGSSGTGCGRGAQDLGSAIEIAMENAMTDLGELIANAPALRETLGPAGDR